MTTTRKRPSTRKPCFSWSNLADTHFAPILDTENYALPTISDWARFCDVDNNTIHRWRRGGIPEKQADRIAVKLLRKHPASIWPEWFDTAPNPRTRRKRNNEPAENEMTNPQKTK